MRLQSNVSSLARASRLVCRLALGSFFDPSTCFSCALITSEMRAPRFFKLWLLLLLVVAFSFPLLPVSSGLSTFSTDGACSCHQRENNSWVDFISICGGFGANPSSIAREVLRKLQASASTSSAHSDTTLESNRITWRCGAPEATASEDEFSSISKFIRHPKHIPQDSAFIFGNFLQLCAEINLGSQSYQVQLICRFSKENYELHKNHKYAPQPTTKIHLKDRVDRKHMVKLRE